MGLGWSYKVEYEGITKRYIDHSHDLGLDRKIREVMESEVDCSYIYATGAHPEAYWMGCGYPNKYLVLNKNLPEPVDDLADDEVVTVTLWDQS
jgi:hypothetical protein